MKLSFCIPGKVYWITSFLDYGLYKGIHDAIIKERNKINLHSSEGKWSDDLIANIVPLGIVTGKQKDNFIWFR